MRKILYIFLVAFVYMFSSLVQAEEARTFVITAYYSPLPNQVTYMKGSYEADIILNGRGTHGASGRPVFVGMIAAPKTYEFGTKIRLDGYGIGTVADRGGAIVSAGNRGYSHDRLDIWMGYGDEGLRRALSWGKRTISGAILSPDAPDTLELSMFPIYKNIYLRGERIPDIIPDRYFADVIFDRPINRDSPQRHIRQVEEVFQFLGYTKTTRGVFDKEFVKTVYDYQLANGIVSSPKDKGAGYLGSQTRRSLKAKILAYRSTKDEIESITLALGELQAQKNEKLTKWRGKITKVINGLKTPKHGTTSSEVRFVQKVLRILGYMDHKDTGYFGTVTHNALTNYQVAKGLIGSTNHTAAGLLGPNTRKALIEDLLQLGINNSSSYKKLAAKIADHNQRLGRLQQKYSSLLASNN